MLLRNLNHRLLLWHLDKHLLTIRCDSNESLWLSSINKLLLLESHNLLLLLLLNKALHLDRIKRDQSKWCLYHCCWLRCLGIVLSDCLNTLAAEQLLQLHLVNSYDLLLLMLLKLLYRHWSLRSHYELLNLLLLLIKCLLLRNLSNLNSLLLRYYLILRLNLLLRLLMVFSIQLKSLRLHLWYINLLMLLDDSWRCESYLLFNLIRGKLSFMKDICQTLTQNCLLLLLLKILLLVRGHLIVMSHYTSLIILLMSLHLLVLLNLLICELLRLILGCCYSDSLRYHQVH